MAQTQETYPLSAEQKARAVEAKIDKALIEATNAVAEETGARTALEAFPEPGERRADTVFRISETAEVALRRAMAEIGIGRETNLSATEAGLKPGYIAVIEGGQAHKMLAELNIVLADKVTVPSRIIIVATPDRIIKKVGEDPVNEREITAKVLGIEPSEVGDNEYKIARQVAIAKGMFQTSMTDFRLGYTIDGNLVLPTENGHGKLMAIGFINEIPVDLLSSERQPNEDGSYKVLGSKGTMRLSAEMATRFFPGSPDVGFVTSATYEPSRLVDSVSVMLELEKTNKPVNIAVATYGTHELADVKKEQPSPPSPGQIAGEAHKAAVQLKTLQELLAAQNQQ